MRLYFVSGSSYNELLFHNGVKNYLFSYYNLRDDENTYNFIKENQDDINVLLDSGAFSAFTRGEFIDRRDYARFVKKIGLPTYINLDVIGSVEDSYTNQLWLEDQGLNPVPVYHYKSKIENLEKLVGKYDYICIGGMILAGVIKPYTWLDDIFNLFPNQKFHGLGMGNEKALVRYPWYSVDTTSWIIQAAKFATLVINGVKIQFGDKITSEHFERLPKLMQKNVENRLDTYGYTYEQVKEDYMVRADITLKQYLELELKINKKPVVFKKKQCELFNLGDME